MRIETTNKSDKLDAVIFALADYAATFFPHRSGLVPVIVKNGKRSHGVCYGKRRCVIWLRCCRLHGEESFPQVFEQMHYFRHANHEKVKTLTCNTWEERALSIIAHEMEHTTDGNRKMRRSRQEIHAWNRSVEVVEASRTPEGQKFIEERISFYRARQLAVLTKQETKKSPQSKQEQCEKLLLKWQRKMKLAQTKIRKLKTRIKYFEKRSAACEAAQKADAQIQAEAMIAEVQNGQTK